MRQRLLTAAAAVVLIVAIGAVQRLIPDADRIYRPIAATGALREEIRTLPYTVRVDSVTISRELEVNKRHGDTEKKTTQGVWVVLGLTASGSKQQVRLGKVQLQAKDGTLYGVTDRFRGIDTLDIEAGIPSSGQVAFELPPADAQGALLQISGARSGSIHTLNGALGPAVEVDLGITATQTRDAVPSTVVEEQA